MRYPGRISEEFLKVQDEYLREENEHKGVTDIVDLTPVEKDIYLWQGDITTLKCDAIVNAANSGKERLFCANNECESSISKALMQI